MTTAPSGTPTRTASKIGSFSKLSSDAAIEVLAPSTPRFAWRPRRSAGVAAIWSPECGSRSCDSAREEGCRVTGKETGTLTDARHQSSFLVGLIGSAIQASLTPAMHEREADENGLRYIYRLIDIEKLGLGVESLPELLTAAERMGFAGVNVTHPCKQLVIPLLHELSDVARALGAVNTVVLSNG